MTTTLPDLQHIRKHLPEAESCTDDLLELMLDRYGLGFICRNPAILFVGSDRAARDPASRISGGSPYLIYRTPHEYIGTPDAAPYRPEASLDRMAEAYSILDHIYAPWPASRRTSQAASYDRLSDRLY